MLYSVLPPYLLANLPAFKSVGIEIASKLTASEMNLYVLIGQNSSKKAYITENGWLSVMSLLNGKRIVYLEKKEDINKTEPKEEPKPFWKRVPWGKVVSVVSSSSVVQGEVAKLKGDAETEVQKLRAGVTG